jgi:hypothetical protein
MDQSSAPIRTTQPNRGSVSIFTDKLGRRLGHRVPTPWQLTIVVPAASGGWRRKRPKRVLATVIDVSVVGARLRCVELPGVVVGSVLSLECQDAEGTVVVRRIAPLSENGPYDYGVEFVTLYPELQQRVSEQVDPSSGRLREVWNTAE